MFPGYGVPMSHGPGAAGRGPSRFNQQGNSDAPVPHNQLAMAPVPGFDHYQGHHMPMPGFVPSQAMLHAGNQLEMMGGGGGVPSHVFPAETSTTTQSRPGDSRNATSVGNSEKSRPEMHKMTFHPPGFPREFDIPFPERRLPVCDRCKKNYKSRDLCRTRDGHKTMPWTTTYIAITVDKSCLTLNLEGKMSFADIPVVAELCELPIVCMGPSDGSMSSEPICKVCREKNYTRDYCRNTCKHTTPPWSCTYVKVVADNRNESEKEKDEKMDKPNASKKRKKQSEGGKDNGDEKDGETDEKDGTSMQRNDESNSDDLTELHPSRTFLAAVSSKSVVVRWCEEIQYPDVSSLGSSQLTPSGKKSSKRMHGSEGKISKPTLSGEKKEENLSSTNPVSELDIGGGENFDHTNDPNPNIYQNHLWEAFRAGAMWAHSQSAQFFTYSYGGVSAHPPMPYFQQPQAGANMQHHVPWGVHMVGHMSSGQNGTGLEVNSGFQSVSNPARPKKPKFRSGNNDGKEGRNVQSILKGVKKSQIQSEDHEES